jgi:hypothetical protein
MAHYGIEDPYDKSNLYYDDHYVCVWEVTREEVVGQWEWEDLAVNANWYEDIVMPAYRQHRRRVEARPMENNVFDMSSIMRGLNGKLSAQSNSKVIRLIATVARNHSDQSDADWLSDSSAEVFE